MERGQGQDAGAGDSENHGDGYPAHPTGSSLP
jgi:hypothetical protein